MGIVALLPELAKREAGQLAFSFQPVPNSQIVGRRGSERYEIRTFSIPGDPIISEPGTGLSVINTATIWETISWIGMRRAGPIKQANPTIRAG